MLARLMALLSGDTAVTQTVGKIKDAIYYTLREPNQAIRRRAESILRASRTLEGQSLDEVKDVFRWVKDHFHYVHDPHGLEYVKSPEVSDQEIAQHGFFMGDCDDAAAYLAALLKAIGYPVRLIVVSPTSSPFDDYQHIFVRVYIPRKSQIFGSDGSTNDPWVSLDPTAKGKPFGWAVVSKRTAEYDV